MADSLNTSGNKRGMYTSPKRGRKWTEDERALALEVWAFRADRSPKRTSDILKADHGLDISSRLIGSWARSDNWLARARELYASVAPGLYESSKFSLVYAASAGAAYLRDVVTQAVPADKLLLSASLAALDRVGFAPWSKAQYQAQSPSRVDRVSSAPAVTDDYSGFTDEQLLQLSAGMLDPAFLPDSLLKTIPGYEPDPSQD